LTFGGDTAITEKSVMLVLPAGSGKKFALTFYRCAVLASGALSWSKEEQVDLPVGDRRAPGGFIAKADLSRRRARQVITMDRASELVPARHGTLLQVLEHWDNYRHPVGYR
jgi:hypothetical protein